MHALAPNVEAADCGHASARPLLPTAFQYTSPQPVLTYQGAEALLYQTHFLRATSAQPTSAAPIAALKHRPAKPYRHPLLDAKLTRHRILSEARILAKLKRSHVSVPALYALDLEAGWLMMEWIRGQSVRAVLDSELGTWLDDMANGDSSMEESYLWRLMGDIGALVGRTHEAGVIHGDLTTSNLLLRAGDDAARSEQETLVVLIDFGLSTQSADVEDRAVDLYVLERAFGSTHPGTEKLFGKVLQAYEHSYKGAKASLRRYEDVRMRGRKKIALG